MQAIITTITISIPLAAAVCLLIKHHRSKQSPQTAPPATELDNDEPPATVTQNTQLIKDFHKLFEEDKIFLQPDIHIDDAARMLYTNRTYITRLMKQEYGLSFIEYVNISRIQYSQKLLYTAQLSLDEVAEQSGFQSTSNYCRAFKRYIGDSPLSWLQKVRNQ